MLSITQLYLIAVTASIIFAWKLLPALVHDENKTKLWAKIDTVGMPSEGAFRWARALFRSLTHTYENVHDGYNKYSRELNRPFALPTIWTGGAVFVMPQSSLHLLNYPDNEVRAFNAQLETIQLPYMISDPDVYMNVIHFDVVRKHMVNSKDVDALAPATSDEIGVAFHDCWGAPDEWVTMNGWDACGRIVTRAATRILIGLPMCRDAALFEQFRLFADAVIMGTAAINCFPGVLRSLVGPLVALRAKYYQARCLKVLVPFVEERIELWKSPQGRTGPVPNDFLQWMIPKCAKNGPEQMDPVKIATRLLALNAMFIIGMAYVFSHAVFDIYGSPDKDVVVGAIESEYKQVLAQYGGLTSKEAVDKLHIADSAIRESMRVSDIGITALARDVVGENVDLGDGIQAPRGARIVFPTHPIHRDPKFYDNPLRFDAFRFSNPSTGHEESDPGQHPERETLTSITPSFFSFGYGKHACPGRWFSSQTMKQALAYIVLNYDVEVMKRPAKRAALLNMMVPQTGVEIRVRKKL